MILCGNVHCKHHGKEDLYSPCNNCSFEQVPKGKARFINRCDNEKNDYAVKKREED